MVRSRRDAPIAAPLLVENCREDRWRIETWPAKPVNRSVTRNERGVENFPDDRIANLDDKTSFWIKISAKTDGSFAVTNARTNTTKTYGPR